jgi:hypothetical protein
MLQLLAGIRLSNLLTGFWSTFDASFVAMTVLFFVSGRRSQFHREFL